MEKEVEQLAKEAAKADTADNAMRYAQAACNVANAMRAVAEAKSLNK